MKEFYHDTINNSPPGRNIGRNENLRRSRRRRGRIHPPGCGKRDELEKLRCYLRQNADGLTDYRPRLPAALRRPDLRGLGGAEGNIAQLLAHRFTGRGMSWSVNGADRLASLIMLGTNGELGRWLAERREGNDRRDLSRPHDIAPLLKRSSPQNGTLPILAGLPVLEGPHQSRPWVEKIRQLSHIQGIT